MRPQRRIPAVLAVLLALTVLALPGASGAQEGKALVRLAHFAENVAVGDIYVVFVNGTQKFDDVPYKTISDYVPLDPGTYKIEVRPARAPSTSPPEAQLSLKVESGRAYTACVWGEGTTVSAMVLNDDMTRPPADKARVRMINAISGSQPVDLVLGSDVLIPGVRPSSASDYQAVDAGTVDLAVRQAGGDVFARSSDVSLRSGTVASVAAIGGSGKARELVVARDAAGSERPAGGIATGGGGTAPRDGRAGWLLALTGIVGATTVLVLRRRRAA